VGAFLTIKLEGPKELRAKLDRLDPTRNAEIFSRSIRTVATLIAANARNVQIRRGGGAVHPKQLTHRTFTLRDSIGPDFRGLPQFAEVGTEKDYGAIHEFGVSNMLVRSHQRTIKKTGRRVNVRAFTRNVPANVRVLVLVAARSVRGAVF